MAIYIEFTLNGQFDNAILTSWDEYHKIMFNPEIDVLLVKVIR